nr:hypothetical protein [Tanacetum cinerariifolium]
MDIKDEIKAFKENKSTKSSSLSDSGQNKPQNLDTGVKRRIGRVSPIKSKSDTAHVVIEKSIGKAAVVKEKSDVVKEKPAVVKEKPAVVKEKLTVVKEKSVVVKEKPAVLKDKHKTEKNSKALDNPKESDKAANVIESDKKAGVVKPFNVVANKAINVVADKVDVAKDKINVQDDPAKVVKESVLAVTKNNLAEDAKNSAPDVVKERRKTMLPKYKPNNKASSVDKCNVLTKLHKDKVLDVVSKDKQRVMLHLL